MIKKLGVNIDHVATIRNARGEDYPNPIRAAVIAQKSGADSITLHRRQNCSVSGMSIGQLEFSKLSIN